LKIDKEKLSLALARKCMGTRDLAEETKLGEATIVKIRSGKQIARTQTIGKIAKALDVDVSEIIE